MGTTAIRRRHSAFAAGLASVAMALGFTAIPADAAPKPRDVDYVALGDSYTAGTGADTVGWTAARPFAPTLPCTQTEGGYVDVVSGADPVELEANAACHGSLLDKPTWDGVYSVNQQITDLAAEGDLSRDTELVSITAGANDLGFAEIIGVCATQSVDVCDAFVDRATSAAALSKLTDSLVETYTSIEAAAPKATIVVFGYPLLFDTSNPVIPLGIPLENQERINEGALAINDTIEAAALEVRAEYVDVTDSFTGHEVNSGSPWIFFGTYVDANGMVQLDPRSFHPNEAGHAAYAAALLASVNLDKLARH